MFKIGWYGALAGNYFVNKSFVAQAMQQTFHLTTDSMVRVQKCQGAEMLPDRDAWRGFDQLSVI